MINNDIIGQTKGYLYDVWPEIEFVEEFIRGLTQKTPPPQPVTDNSNSVTEPNRVSLGAIEFPVSNEVFANKLDVYYIYEIKNKLLKKVSQQFITKFVYCQLLKNSLFESLDA
jgi:hypothetical protein